MNPLLLAALTLGPVDTPITPIDSALIEMQVGDLTELCPEYVVIVAVLAGVTDDAELAEEMVISYAITSWEEGFDDTGNSRMTSEAREVFTETMQSCSAP